MANNISFLIKNKQYQSGNGKHNTASFLYREQNNQLDFVFTNNGLGDLPLTHGDTFVINIPIDLLKSAGKDQFDSASDWELTNDPSLVNNGVYPYIFTPKTGKTINILNNGNLSISLQKLKGGKAYTDYITVNVNVSGVVPIGPPQKLFVFNAPKEGDKDITYRLLNPSVSVNDMQQNITINTLYISPTDNELLVPPIANTMHLNLAFSGSALVNSWPVNKIPKFIFSFSYSNQTNSQEALTNALKKGEPGYSSLTSAWSINTPTEGNKVRVDQNSLWESQNLNPNTQTPSWQVAATGANKQLFSSANPDLDVHFKHLISVLVGEDTMVYIQWENIPGYYPGVYALNVKKAKPKPSDYITDFFGPDKQTVAQVAFDTPVTFSWNSFAAAQIQLIDADADRILFTTPVPTKPDTEPVLIYCGGIVPNASAGTGICNNESVFCLVPDKLVSHYVLQALDAKGNKLDGQTDPVTINLKDLPSPSILKFDVTIQALEGINSVCFSWKTQNATNGVILDGDIEIPLNHINEGSISRPITENNPIFQTYDIQVTNIDYQTSAHLTRTFGFQLKNKLATSDIPSKLALGLDGVLWVTFSNSTSVMSFKLQGTDLKPSKTLKLNSNGVSVCVGQGNPSTIYVSSENKDLTIFDSAKIGPGYSPKVYQMLSIFSVFVVKDNFTGDEFDKTMNPTTFVSIGSLIEGYSPSLDPTILTANVEFSSSPENPTGTVKASSNIITDATGTYFWWIIAEINSLVQINTNQGDDPKYYSLSTPSGASGNEFLIDFNASENEIWVLSKNTKTCEIIKLGTRIRQTFTYEEDISSFVIMPDGMHLFISTKGTNNILYSNLGYH